MKINRQHISLIIILIGLSLAPFLAFSTSFWTGALPGFIVLVGALLYFTENKKDVYNKYMPNTLIVLTLTGLILSVASPNLFLSAASCTLLLGMAVVVMIISSLSRKRDFMLYLLMAVFGICILISVIAFAKCILDSGGGAGFGKALSNGSVDRIFGGFVNPNFFASYLAMCLPVGLGLFFVFKERSFKMLLAIGIFVSFVALLLTGSKFGLVSFCVGLFVFVLFSFMLGKPKKQSVINGVILTLILLIAVVGFGKSLLFRVDNAAAGGSEAHSSLFRVYTWKSALDMISDNYLLGVSPGRFAESFPMYAQASITKHAHNSYLQFISEYGLIVSSVLFVWFLIIIYTAFAFVKHKELLADVSLKEADNSNKYFLFAGVAGGVAAIIVHNLVDSDFHVAAIGLIASVLMGIILSCTNLFLKENNKYKYITSERIIILTLVMLVWLGLSDGFFAAGRNDLAVKTAMFNSDAWLAYADENDSLDNILHKLEEAKEYAPRNYLVYQKLGDFYFRQNTRSKEALNYYERALVFHPKSTLLMKRVISCADATGNTHLADKYYNMLVKQENTPYEKVKGVPEMVDTNYAYAHVYLGDKYLAQNNIKKARAEYVKAADRLKRWKSNEDFLMISVVSGASNILRIETDVQLYKKALIKLGEIDKKDSKKDIERLDDWFYSFKDKLVDLTNS